MNNAFHNIGNLVSDLFKIDYIKNNFPSYLMICLEGFIITLISIYICGFINVATPGILSIFFIASAFVLRLSQILELNKKNIIDLKENVFVSNQNSIIEVVFIFIGIFVGYITVSIFVGNTIILSYFSEFINVPQQQIIIQDRFNSFFIIFYNNVGVAILSFLLSLIYRAFGMTLTITWNACIWGVTFSVIFIKHQNILLSCIAIMPHLVIEVISYITVSLAAIFLSKAIILYQLSDRIFINIAKTVFIMIFISFLLIAFSSFIEVYYTPFIFSFR